MSVLLFIVILVILILVHEFGHFIIAKKSGIRVDEFGLGYPPKVIGWKRGETAYTLNLLPFGGFVKIFGEDPTEEDTTGPDSARSMVNKPRYVQVAVLAAGVIFNVIFAWLLISAGYMAGLPSPADSDLGTVRDVELTLVGVQPGSPAYSAGLKAGDRIRSLSAAGETQAATSADSVVDFIARHQDGPITFVHERGGEELSTDIVPVSGIVENQKAVGISMEMVGILELPPHKALWQGMKTSWNIIASIVGGLWDLLSSAFRGESSLAQVSGPVGIAGLVGDAQKLGLSYIMTFTAFISLNLAVINLVPFPALDGGRILFVAIEGITRRRINPNFVNTVNVVGFVLLLALMAAVTVNDILRLF